ncbi:MAG: GNAT family N-acetyltransferase [Roseiflexaceae bacterium]|jgi:GNAT superfamily N-acetyltransferase
MSINIVPVTLDNLDQVLPLIADYQRFYKVEPDEVRNRIHFGRLATAPSQGAQWLALDENGEAVGFVTAYRVLSSTLAVERCLLNDLYVMPTVRGRGVGRQLIIHCAEWAVAEGYNGIYWRTADDNYTAQRLYDSLPTTRRTWIDYTLNQNALASLREQ